MDPGSVDPHVLARRLDLAPLPGEGGLFRRTHVDEHSSAILYLLIAPDFSALHRLPGVEVWHFHAGAPVDLLLLRPGGGVSRVELSAGSPQAVVPGGVWQAAVCRGAWALLGTTMAPPYADGDLELADRDVLLAGWPAAAPTIHRLTRPPAPA